MQKCGQMFINTTVSDKRYRYVHGCQSNRSSHSWARELLYYWNHNYFPELAGVRIGLKSGDKC